MTEDLLKLAAKVEAATGPDRELDADILEIVFPAQFEKLRIEAGMPSGAPNAVMTKGARELVIHRSRYWFSSSLDAATALVPKGFMWRLQVWPDGVNSALLEKNPGDCGAIDAWQTETFAALPALALTAAALRARAAALQGEG